MYCKECGKQLDNASKFCSYCGTKQSINQVPENKIDLSTKPDPITQNVNISLSFRKAKDKSIKDEVKVDKYDRTYDGDHESTVVGVIVMIISLIILTTVNIDNETDLQIYKALAATINIFWRIIVTIWVVDIAKRQNRDTTAWGIFAFIIPNLALIIIGLLKKLYKPTSEAVITEPSNEIGKAPDNLKVGSTETITTKEDVPINDSDDIAYDLISSSKTILFWGQEQEELKITFQDGKMGKVFFSNSLKKYYFRSGLWWPNYYNSKNAAINALHYYLCYKRVMVKDIYYYM